MSQLAYVNGKLVNLDEAHVSVQDRGFIFADGIYEVIRVYAGRPFHLDRHLTRLGQSARAIELPLDPETVSSLEGVARELVAANDLEEGVVYMQVTRGAAPRRHPFPEQIHPTVIAFTQAASAPPESLIQNGIAAITVPDNRGGLCQVKTTALLPNVLAREKARRAGVQEALFVRDGIVTEGSSSNVFAVLKGALFTHPIANILPGITRGLALELAHRLALPVCEEALFLDRFLVAEEIFLSGTTVEILPVTTVDGKMIGTGRPGPVTRRLYDEFQREIADHRCCPAAAPESPG